MAVRWCKFILHTPEQNSCIGSAPLPYSEQIKKKTSHATSGKRDKERQDFE
ncbi:hypothetical protein J6590_073302 [Homalodisca vitripennis]|nr:hypothetical protein J6590_073302 [Homalodisca vitripennis]